MLYKPEYIECQACGNDEFYEKQVVKFRPNALRRDTEAHPIPSSEQPKFIYVCANCGHKLNM